MAYPLKLRSVALPKVWGGRQLEHVLGRRLPGDEPIGEVWTAWDGLRVANGPAVGEKLADLVSQTPELIDGQREPDLPSACPLLIKFLEARENLSIQVHPNDAYARAKEGQPYGKCEAWYVLTAEADASVIQGVKQPMTPADLVDAARHDRIVELLEYVPVRVGDVLINTPGTIHALCAGVVIYELQQSSDLTYRLYDWNRGGSTRRPLHLSQSADVADLQPMSRHTIAPVVIPGDRYRLSYLCACRYFAAEHLDLAPDAAVMRRARQFRVVSVVAGRCLLRHTSLAVGSLLLRPGESVVLPAGLGEYVLQTTWSSCQLIESYVPDLATDVVQPLRELGVSEENILQLGGDPSRSDLRSFMTSL